MLEAGLSLTLEVLAAGLFGWSCLTVARSPLRWLWKPGVAATEWGHWLSAFSLALALAGFASGRAVAGLVAASAGILFAQPALRALVMARRNRTRIRLRRLLHVPLPQVLPTRETYRSVGGMPLTLDFYPAVSPGSRGETETLVLSVHGGSWNSGDSTQLSGLNRYLASRGYPVAAINYRLAPSHPFPSPLEDISAAIAWLEARPGRTWDRIVLFGRSSGGHLALLAAYRLPHAAVRGVIALYSPTDLAWSWQRPAPRRLMDSNQILREFLGGELEERPEVFEAASPIGWVRADVPPTLLVHGGKDELVSPLQSRRLAAALEEAGARWSLLEVPWGKHGMDANLAGPSGQIILPAIERFLEDLSRGSAAAT